MSLDRKKAPEFKQVDRIDFINPIEKVLDNGIVLNYLNGGSQDILKIDFIFNAGVWTQPKALVAGATNNLMKEGTKSYSAFEIAEGIDQYGAFLEMDNSFDESSVTLYTLTKHLDKVLPLVKEVICFPAFSQKEFNIYKNNAIERFNINLEKGSFVARKEFSALIFGMENPYGGNVSLSDYENLSLEDIKVYHQKNYQLSNCKIVVSGKVNDTALASINTAFGKDKTTLNSTPTKETKAHHSSEKNRFILKENALQSAIRIGRLMPNKLHPDYFGLQIFNTVLGGYFGSRLMTNIREDKGYTYGIGSGILSLKNGGYFFISTEVGADVTKDALKEIYKEIDVLTKELVPQEELDLVKNYMLGQFLKSCDGAFNMASLFESVDNYDLKYDFYDKYIDTIKNITPKTLMELGAKYFMRIDLKEVVVGKV